mgnify:CR=1 FL=1
MSKVFITQLILILASPKLVFSQPIRIPVIPFNKRDSSVALKIHNKCKSIENYANCVKRYLRIY